MGMDGVIIIDKPYGLSSSAVVLQVKRMLGARKAGHAGTLDPLATGVLPLCINQGTKLVPFFMQGVKEYIATLRLGIETDTQDREGTVIRQTEMMPVDHAEIVRIFDEFRGEVLQTPPMFSALKHNGVPLYRMARRGEDIPRRARRVTIECIRVLSVALPYISFFVRCSPGTYIRTLCADIGARLHCGAHMVELQRVRNGAFHINRSLPLEDLRIAARNGSITQHLIPLNDALPELPAVAIDQELGKKVSHGIPCRAGDLAGMALPRFSASDQIKLVTHDGRLIAIAECCIDSDTLLTLAPGQPVFKILRNFQMQGLD